MKVLGRQRSSRASTASRAVHGRWERRNVATDGRDFEYVRNLRSHMAVSFAMRSAIE